MGEDLQNSRGFLVFIKRTWSFISSIIAVLTSIVSFIYLWKGSKDLLTFITLGSGITVAIMSLIWIGFRYTKEELYVGRIRKKTILQANC